VDHRAERISRGNHASHYEHDAPRPATTHDIAFYERSSLARQAWEGLRSPASPAWSGQAEQTRLTLSDYSQVPSTESHDARTGSCSRPEAWCGRAARRIAISSISFVSSTSSVSPPESRRHSVWTSTLGTAVRLLYRAEPRAFVVSTLASIGEPLFFPGVLITLRFALHGSTMTSTIVHLTPAATPAGPRWQDWC
jgi:hypothetical protein